MSSYRVDDPCFTLTFSYSKAVSRMFATTSRRAVSLKSGPMSLSAASAQLLPPLPLYRRILRAHRRLPEDMRFMGDSYIKSEYRKTRATENPLHIIAFLSQWKLYLDEVETQTAREGEAWKGRKLSQDMFDKMSNEQAGQLYELMHATKDVWKSPEQLETEAVKSEGEPDSDPFKKPQ